MTNMREVLESPAQRAGELWQKAYATLISSNPKEIKSLAGDQYYATEEIRPADYMSSGSAGRKDPVYLHKYSVASLKSGRKPTDSDALYLVADGNYATPVLKFDPRLESLMVLGGDFNQLSDAYQYVPTILNCIAAEIKDQQDRAERQARDRLDRIKTRIGATVGALTVAGVLGGGVFGIVYHVQERHRQKSEQQANLRKAFDPRNINIGGLATEAGDLSFVSSNPSFFGNGVPNKTKHDTFSHPRKVSVDSTGCTTVAHINPNFQAVKAVTDSSPETLFLAVNSAGQTEVCNFDQNRDSNSPPIQLAIQVVRASR